MNKIVVIGSTNLDIVAKVIHLPLPGETVGNGTLFEPIGGKIAAFILILGIVGSGISSIFTIILIAPWLISDYTGNQETSVHLCNAYLG